MHMIQKKIVTFLMAAKVGQCFTVVIDFSFMSVNALAACLAVIFRTPV